MKVAFLIPHCFLGDNSKALHGSSWPGARAFRRAMLDRAVFQIHSLFGNRYRALDGFTLNVLQGANPFAVDFDIFVFTTRGLHLVNELATAGRHFNHIETDAEPPVLGFECAKWIRDHLGTYDYYFYLEDDLLIHDSLFLMKIDLFNQLIGREQPDILLQPQRYELALLAHDPAVLADIDKLYIDYMHSGLTPPTGRILRMNFLGIEIVLEPAPNPHAGCYMISNAQAERVVRHPDFLHHSKIYDAPGDTAATGFVSQALRVYKPAQQSLSFLEIQHGHQVCLRMDES